MVSVIYLLNLFGAFCFIYVSCKDIAFLTYCCIKSGEIHVFCLHPSRKVSTSCVEYKNLLPNDDTDVVDVINTFRDHVASGSVENASPASMMKKLKSSRELKLMADVLLRQCFLKLEPAFLHGYSLNSIHFPTVWVYIAQKDKARPILNPASYLRLKLGSKGKDSHSFVSPVTDLLDNGLQYGQLTSFLLDMALYAGCGSASFKTPNGTATDNPYYFTLLCILGPSNYNMTGVFPYTKGQATNSCDPKFNSTDNRYPHLCSTASALADNIYFLVSRVIACLLQALTFRLSTASFFASTFFTK